MNIRKIMIHTYLSFHKLNKRVLLMIVEKRIQSNIAFIFGILSVL